MGLNAAVLGGGSFGTALAAQLARVGHRTRLWERHADRAAHINQHHRNPRYLVGVDLPPSLEATADLTHALHGAELVVIAVPSVAAQSVLAAATPHLEVGTFVCCATKGIDDETLLPVVDLVDAALPESLRAGVTVFSGPTFAAELAAGLPTAAVVAGSEAAAAFVSRAFHGGNVRCYHAEDRVGVCVGGAVKNVLAIATGISDGLGLGANARAALLTRGLNEITRLVVAMGGEAPTMMGLAGVGDLVLTCTGDLSRNRRVGLALGQGRDLASILAELGQVAEGVVTARSAYRLAVLKGVEMPITEQVYRIVHEDRPAGEALAELLGRRRRHERDDG
jgi:glycerol-3-phosphate dehydrogenase (NAD(P)+)